jgi:7,8-dihydroneopterin aldolase/epimerase/oxygenase
MSKITIADLEVYYHVGVTDEERAQPQRLLLTVELIFDFSSAAAGDRLIRTIDYYAVTQRLLKFGEGRSWKLIEKVTVNVAGMVLAEFKPEAVSVEVKKFVIPQARYVSAMWTQNLNQ